MAALTRADANTGDLSDAELAELLYDNPDVIVRGIHGIAEERVAACMADAGFSYAPAPMDASDTPNDDYLASLSEAESAAYDAAYSGEGGCASQRLDVLEEYQTIQDGFIAASTPQTSSEAAQRFTSEWHQCMADAGVSLEQYQGAVEGDEQLFAEAMTIGLEELLNRAAPVIEPGMDELAEEAAEAADAASQAAESTTGDDADALSAATEVLESVVATAEALSEEAASHNDGGNGTDPALVEESLGALAGALSSADAVEAIATDAGAAEVANASQDVEGSAGDLEAALEPIVDEVAAADLERIDDVAETQSAQLDTADTCATDAAPDDQAIMRAAALSLLTEFVGDHRTALLEVLDAA